MRRNPSLHWIDLADDLLFSEAERLSSSGNASGKSPHRSWSGRIRRIPVKVLPYLPAPDQIHALAPSRSSISSQEMSFVIWLRSALLISGASIGIISSLHPRWYPSPYRRDSSIFWFCTVINSLEFLTGTDWPVDRTGCDSKLFFDIIQQFKWYLWHHGPSY